MARPFRGTGFASHTKTLKIVGFCDFQLSPLPKIGEGFGEWSEAFLARKVGWSVKKVQGEPCIRPLCKGGCQPNGGFT